VFVFIKSYISLIITAPIFTPIFSHTFPLPIEISIDPL
jgi:hypothetical protein